MLVRDGLELGSAGRRPRARARARRAALGRATSRAASRTCSKIPSTPARSSASRSRSPTRSRASSACAPQLVQNDWTHARAFARARQLRRDLERARGDARARGAHRVHAAVLHVSPSACRRATAIRACVTWRRCAGCAWARSPTRLAWDMLEPRGRAARAVRGRRRAVSRSRAGPHRRGAARRHHRAALRRQARRSRGRATSATGDYVAGVRRGDTRPLRQRARSTALERMERVAVELRRRSWRAGGSTTRAAARAARRARGRRRCAAVSGVHARRRTSCGCSCRARWSRSSIQQRGDGARGRCSGLLLAIARLPSPFVLRVLLARAATVYVEVFRGTPVLLQLYVLYYGLAPVARARSRSPRRSLGLGPELRRVRSRDLSRRHSGRAARRRSKPRARSACRGGSRCGA